MFSCVCVAVQKSAVIFASLDISAQNFPGLLISLKSNFWTGNFGPLGPRGQAQPKKMGLLPNISPPWVWGQGGRFIPFWKGEDEANKMLEAEF